MLIFTLYYPSHSIGKAMKTLNILNLQFNNYALYTNGVNKFYTNVQPYFTIATM